MDGLIALGSGGASLVVALLLIAGARGNNKIKIPRDHIPYWAAAVGMLSAIGGSALHPLGDVGQQLNLAFQHAHGLGEWKTASTAAVVTIGIFGFKARAVKDTILGAIAPSLYLASGGLLALPFSIAGSLLAALLGA